MKLDPVSLSLFIAVIEEGSIAAAAEREHIAAPAVSKRIATLEETLRTKLLTRHHKGVEPTAAGYALLNLSRRAVNYLDEIHAEMLDFASGTCTGSDCLDTGLQLRRPLSWWLRDGLHGVT